MNLTELQQKIKAGNLNPHTLAEYQLQLSGLYSQMSTEAGTLEDEYATWYITNQDSYKSVKATEMAWRATDKGKRLAFLKREMKNCEKMISSAKTQLRIKEYEMRNIA